MKALKRLAVSFFRSSFDPGYYREVLVERSTFTLTYFLVLQLILSIVASAHILIPLFKFDFSRLQAGVEQVVPAGIEVQFASGRLTVNQALPFAIPFPRKWSEYGVHALPTNIVTFIPEEELLSMRDVLAYDSVVVVGPTEAYAISSDTPPEMRVIAYPTEGQHFAVTSDHVIEAVHRFVSHPFIASKWYLWLVGWIVAAVVWPILIFWRLLVVVVLAFLATLALGFIKPTWRLRFGQMVRVTIHALTVVWVVSQAVSLVSPLRLHGIWFFMVYVGFLLVIGAAGGLQAGQATMQHHKSTKSTKSSGHGTMKSATKRSSVAHPTKSSAKSRAKT